MKQKLLLILLLVTSICGTGWARSRSTAANMGGEIDFYVEYSPSKMFTLFVGEELYLNFVDYPGASIFDAAYTSVGFSVAPHSNISLSAAYDFQYLNSGVVRHRVKLMATPKVHFGNFTLSLRERAQMTYNTVWNSADWLLRSRLKLEYKAKKVPLCPYLYVEMYNPLEYSAYWVESVAYGVGLDISVGKYSTIGVYYELMQEVSYTDFYHLFGMAYTISF